MKKKVLYFIHSLCRYRTVKTFKETPELEQMVIGPDPVTYDGVEENYDEFKIDKIQTYSNNRQAQKMVDKFSPDVVVQTEMHNTIKFPAPAKLVFVMHGMIGNHVIDNFKNHDLKSWKGFDLYCGAAQEFKNWIKHINGKDDNVVLNALPQFDLFHESNYSALEREKIIQKTRSPGAKKIILYYGFCCKNRKDYNEHNEDYFKTVIELENIAKKNNWVALIKPRQEFSQAKKFINQEKWAKKYLHPYTELQKSKFLYFLHPDTSIYNYFSADLIVGNGYSTLETEACLAHKPLVLIRTKSPPDKYDPFDTIRCGAANYVSDLTKLEQAILHGLSDQSYVQKQNKFIEEKGIIIDGLSYKRVQDAILAL